MDSRFWVVTRYKYDWRVVFSTGVVLLLKTDGDTILDAKWYERAGESLQYVDRFIGESVSDLQGVLVDAVWFPFQKTYQKNSL